MPIREPKTPSAEAPAPLSAPLERARAVVARNVSAARSAVGASQEELARDAAVSRATVVQLEAGEGDPRLSTLAGVAAALGVAPAFLLLGADELAAIASAPTSPEAEKVRRHLPEEQLDAMRRLLRSGVPKQATKAVAIGSEAVASAGLARGAVVGAAIGTVLLPGLGTQIGAALGAWKAKRKGRPAGGDA